MRYTIDFAGCSPTLTLTMATSIRDGDSYQSTKYLLDVLNRRPVWRRRAPRTRAVRTVRRAVDPEPEARHSDRAQLAASIDAALRVACSSEAAARYELGRAAHALITCRGYQRLGFVRLSDYAPERLGVSARTLQSAAWVATRLGTLTRIESAFDRGELSWAKVRALCAFVTPEYEGAWLERARHASAHELDVVAQQMRATAHALRIRNRTTASSTASRRCASASRVRHAFARFGATPASWRAGWRARRWFRGMRRRSSRPKRSRDVRLALHSAIARCSRRCASPHACAVARRSAARLQPHPTVSRPVVMQTTLELTASLPRSTLLRTALPR